jgi:hypothetical protein
MNYTITLNFDDSEVEVEIIAQSADQALAAVIAEHGREDWTSFVIVGVRQRLHA